MNRQMITGTVLGALLATAGGAGAYKVFYAEPSRADVLDVRQLTQTVKTPRQVCHDEQVTRQEPVKDEKRIAGTAIGAVVGGVIGHQVGGGTGKTIATVAGAAAGGYAGNKAQQKMQENDTYTATEQRCTTVYDSREEPAGFEVRYRLKDKEGVVTMDHDPGEYIPVRDGELVLVKQPGAPDKS